MADQDVAPEVSGSLSEFEGVKGSESMLMLKGEASSGEEGGKSMVEEVVSGVNL
jgi:hypothetical protein